MSGPYKKGIATSEADADWGYAGTEFTGDIERGLFPEGFHYGLDEDDDFIFEIVWTALLRQGAIELRVPEAIDEIENHGPVLVRQKTWWTDWNAAPQDMTSVTEYLFLDDEWATLANLTFGGQLKRAV